MRSIARFAISAGFLAAGITGAAAQTTGDWVLARWKGGAHWYPGVVQSVSSGRVLVAYDDGDRETIDLDKVRPYNWVIGGKVECNFKNSGSWYPGVISSLGGEKISISYDDGDKETTKTGRCRSN